MKVSVIIPTLNEADIIELSIRRAWDCGASEVIVSDGGSADSTVEIASASNCQLIRSGRGRGIQLNAGAAIATGDVLLFLHADNWLAPSGCQQIQDCISRFGCPACGAFRQRIESQRKIYRLIESGNRLRVSLFSLAYGDQGIFVTRDLFNTVEGFPEIALMEDFSFSRRIRKHRRYRLLDGPLFISPRRWEHRGPVRQTILNWTMVVAYLSGASPERLANKYYRQKSNLA